MFRVLKQSLSGPVPTYFPNKLSKNDFWWGLVFIFNRVSRSRIKLVGPDRACAEWLMKNGAFVKWKHSDTFVEHYNGLPLDPKDTGTYLIKEVDATDAAISYHGFPYFDGCKYIDKIKFANCLYIDNKAISLLKYVKNSLKDLEISNCKYITDEGLKSLEQLEKLKTLKISELNKVKDLNGTVSALNKSLPNCEITAD